MVLGRNKNEKKMERGSSRMMACRRGAPFAMGNRCSFLPYTG